METLHPGAAMAFICVFVAAAAGTLPSTSSHYQKKKMLMNWKFRENQGKLFSSWKDFQDWKG